MKPELYWASVTSELFASKIYMHMIEVDLDVPYEVLVDRCAQPYTYPVEFSIVAFIRSSSSRALPKFRYGRTRTRTAVRYGTRVLSLGTVGVSRG